MSKHLLFIAIILLLSLILIAVLIWPNYQIFTSLKDEIFLKQNEFDAQEKYFQELKTTSEELKKYEVNLAKVDSILPSDPAVPQFLDFIQKTCSLTGLSIKEVILSGTTKQENVNVKETRIKIGLIGNYPQLKNFISVVEKSARLTEIENISFDYPMAGPFIFNLTMKVYSH